METNPLIRDCGWDPNARLPDPAPRDASTITAPQGRKPEAPKDSMVHVGKTLKDLENSRDPKKGPIAGNPYSPVPLSEQVREEAPQNLGIIEGNPY